jgi:transcription elongation factor
VTSSDANFEHMTDLGFRNPYSAAENEKILNIINTSSMSDLRKFNIALARINRLVERREKLGDFHSIEDMLEIESFGIKILEKFCDSIIQADLQAGEILQIT